MQCDLVATFFHPIHRDQDIERHGGGDGNISDFDDHQQLATTSSTSIVISGAIQLELNYDRRRGQMQILVCFPGEIIINFVKK